MALVGRGVDSGTGIDVLADAGVTGDMQVVKLGIATLGSEVLIPADASTGLLVNVAAVAPGTAAASLGKAEDAVAASGDVGVMALAVRRDTVIADAVAGDYQPLHVDSVGQLWITGTQLEDAAASSGASGHFVLAVRRDAPTSGAAAGDYHEFQVDSLGRLWTTGTVAEDAAHASGDYGKFVLGVQSLARTSRSADGDYTPFAVDAAGAMFSSNVPEGNSAWACSNYAGHAAASGVIKASAGKLYGVTLTSDNAAMQYVMFFNSTTVPVDTTAPLFAVCVPADSTIQLDFSNMGKYFSTGIAWSNSSTFATKTIGSADCSVEARYL